MNDTENDRKFVAAVLRAVYETIQESPDGAPAGHLYAALMAHGISLETFEKIMEMMILSKLVRKSGHLYHAVKK